ncbi:MAG: hypothetical protein LBT46_02885 [Planctomycetaceae bacterium]|nr:hypothetical protein [Planctomycetaceae bacterium]
MAENPAPAETNLAGTAVAETVRAVNDAAGINLADSPAAQSPAKPHRIAPNGVAFSKLINSPSAPSAAHVAAPFAEREPAKRLYTDPHSDTEVALDIPDSLPASGDFDGYLFAAALPREKYLDRMLLILTPTVKTGNDLVETQYDSFLNHLHRSFVEICTSPKGNFIKDIAVKIRDEIIHRTAFAIAMRIPPFEDATKTQIWFEKLRLEIEDKRKSEKVKLWTPVLQKLRIIYFQQNWGWSWNLYERDDYWDAFESQRKIPRPELFPAYRWREKEAAAKVQEKNKARVKSAAEQTHGSDLVKRTEIMETLYRLENERRERDGLGSMNYSDKMTFYKSVTGSPSHPTALADLLERGKKIIADKSAAFQKHKNAVVLSENKNMPQQIISAIVISNNVKT